MGAQLRDFRDFQNVLFAFDLRLQVLNVRAVLKADMYPFAMISPKFSRTALAVLPTSFQGEFAEAEALYGRCQILEEANLGPDHHDVATTLDYRVGVLRKQVRTCRTLRKNLYS